METSTVQGLRKVISERLTAAVEEIFAVFETTIVKYEDEIERQRRLLDEVWKPQIKLHRIGPWNLNYLYINYKHIIELN